MGIMCSVHGISESDLGGLEGNDDNLLEFFETAEDSIDLDKAWHAIHFLLTGSAWEGDPPLNFIVAGGRPITKPEGECEDARFFSVSEVRAIQCALAPITAGELLHRYDAEAMIEADIYPTIWHRLEEQQVHKDYIAENFGQLKQHIDGLVSRSKAMIVSVE